MDITRFSLRGGGGGAGLGLSARVLTYCMLDCNNAFFP